MKAKHIIPIIGVLGTITTLFILKGSNSQVVKSSTQITPKPEKLFAGVPISQLTKLAKKVSHGLYCTIDQWGFLVFHSKSNRGHQTFHTQMTLDETGKLINLGGHYPGQWCSSADEFVKQANEIFKFRK